jgi:hypothetical protein
MNSGSAGWTTIIVKKSLMSGFGSVEAVTTTSTGDCDTNVDWQARKFGLKNKHDLQILRLTTREHLAEPAASLDTFAARLVERYNLIQTPETVRTIMSRLGKATRCSP